MRPLIEILEDERKLTQRLESVCRYLLRDDDPELLSILYAKKDSLERDLNKVRTEIFDYMEELLDRHGN